MVSSGPNNGSSAANVTRFGGDAWTNPTDALSSNNVYSTCAASSNRSDNLEVTGFGFSIPAGATIDGIEIEVEAKSGASGSGLNFTTWAIKSGSLFGGTIVRTATASDAYYTFGGPTEKFGTTWTVADINDAAFGCSVRFYEIATGTHSVDHVRITVYYTEAPPPFNLGIDYPHAQVFARHAARHTQEMVQRVVSTIWQAEFLPFSSPGISRELQWRLGGRVQLSPELQWRLGGKVVQERSLQWRVAPSPLRVHYALTGRSGPVSYTFRFERRTIANQFLEDVTPAFLGGSIEANNDRDVFRTATFTVDANAVDDRGNAVTIDPLADHIAVYMDLLVDGSYTLGLPMGLFALNVPRKRFEPSGETWEVSASDNGIHLMEATTTASYTVAASQNYLTGTNAVRDILDAFGLSHALPSTTLTLPVARTWPAGTPWLRVVNDLLHAAGMYSLWFDASGTARTRSYDDLSTRTPDVTYTGDDFVLIPITEEAETTRLANQVVAVVDDPSRAVLTSVKTNADPDSPISTVSLGRTITKVLNADAADQATLDAIAENYLRDEAGLYRRATLLTSIDPRRDAHEVYELTVDGVYAAERWWARNWRVQLSIGAQHQHTLGKVERVHAS